MSKKGFTLIELAIVLVIIGLLIGGILTAQTLIRSSKTDMLIRNLSQADVATSTFASNYRYQPGDAPLFTNPGNGNGVLEDADLGAITVNFTGEVARFYEHLDIVGDLKHEKEAYTATVPAAGITAGVNVQTSPYGIRGTGFVPVNAAYVVDKIGGTANGTWLALLGLPSGAGTVITGQHAFTQYDALSLEEKMDDKKANTGRLRAGTEASGCTSTGGAFGFTYGANDQTRNCTIYFNVWNIRGSSN